MDTHAFWIGEKFPDFSLKDDSDGIYSKADLLGDWSVIFFYPKDGSPGCTIESCFFRDKQSKIESLGAKIIGISADSVSRHQKFKEKHNIQFKLLSDPQNRLPKKLRLKRTLGFMRARVTFVVDSEGVIQATTTSQFNPIKHVTRTIRQLRKLTSN
mgnify:CR=1 FL=1|tara:strand:- start:2111 stop:2578 length:468 start_codon:yes stop_codon:yes gene_type:complete